MNKLIVVTGASRGIGKAIAEKFASVGFDLFLTARNGEALESVKQDLEKNYKARVTIDTADLAEKTSTQALIESIEKSDRKIDVLVNNAGFFVPGKVTTEDDGVLESMMAGNVYSAYRLTRGLLPLLHSGSHIFNMCSIASFMAYPNGGSYTISKFALLGFTKVLREELKPAGVRVTAIMPGATLTPSWEGAGLPDERLMKASDVADTIFAAWSLSERSVVEEIIIRPQLGDI